MQGEIAHLRSPAIRVKIKKGMGQHYTPCAGLLAPDLYDSRCLRHLTSNSREHNEEASLFAKTGFLFDLELPRGSRLETGMIEKIKGYNVAYYRYSVICGI